MKFMRSLSVRLTLLGSVIVLGTAAILTTDFWKGDPTAKATPPGPEGTDETEETDSGAPKPIPAPGGPRDTTADGAVRLASGISEDDPPDEEVREPEVLPLPAPSTRPPSRLSFSDEDAAPAEDSRPANPAAALPVSPPAWAGGSGNSGGGSFPANPSAGSASDPSQPQVGGPANGSITGDGSSGSLPLPPLRQTPADGVAGNSARFTDGSADGSAGSLTGDGSADASSGGPLTDDRTGSGGALSGPPRGGYSLPRPTPGSALPAEASDANDPYANMGDPYATQPTTTSPYGTNPYAGGASDSGAGTATYPAAAPRYGVEGDSAEVDLSRLQDSAPATGQPYSGTPGYPSLPRGTVAPSTPAGREIGSLPSYGTGAAEARPAIPLPAEPEGPALSSRPGERRLEGEQSPSVLVMKSFPAEIQVNRPATFELLVANRGPTAAQDVVVTDVVPEGTEFLEALPAGTPDSYGVIQWQLGTMEPGDEVTIQVRVMPRAEGEIGSVARVAFHAQATARTVCTQPSLLVEHTGPRKVLIGQPVIFDITLSNNGSGAAEQVMLLEDVPAGLSHEAGRALESEIGTIRPGETKRLQLQLRAETPGLVRNRIVVEAAGNIQHTDDLELEVIAPDLRTVLAGPQRRYLQREATYRVLVENPGTADAENVELTAHLPKGMTFVETDHQGQYDASRHAVVWSLRELPPQQRGEVGLVVLPTEAGEQVIRVEGRADLDLLHTYEHTVRVDSLAELTFTIEDSADPIEVGAETTYEVRITNQGTRVDSNVRLQVEFPSGVEPLEVEGPTEGGIRGRTVLFAPLPKIEPGEEAVYRIHGRGAADGDHLIRAALASDELPLPVTKEESTRIYVDQ